MRPLVTRSPNHDWYKLRMEDSGQDLPFVSSSPRQVMALESDLRRPKEQADFGGSPLRLPSPPDLLSPAAVAANIRREV